jgi:ATP-dependent Clp protease adaptor protein ClpS
VRWILGLGSGMGLRYASIAARQASRRRCVPNLPSTVDAGDNTAMSQVIESPVRVEEVELGDVWQEDRPWIVIVWNDPINLMSYVTMVFRKLFGYSEAKATKLMLQVHHEGKAVVSGGTREKAEADVSRLHAHGLWATMQQDT